MLVARWARYSREMRTLVVVMLSWLVLACGGEPAPDGGPGDAGNARDSGATDSGATAIDGGTDAAAPQERRTIDGFVEASGPVLEPEVGFFEWHPRSEPGLVFFYHDLDDYCDGRPLPDTLLTSIEDGFTELRSRGRKAIVRFRYSSGSLNACGRADAESIEIVEAHIAQLGPLLEENADAIAYVEAGFLGMWGEWHGYGAPAGTALAESAENRRRVVEALLAVVPAPRAINLRRPRFREELDGVVDLARIGFHNDCFLASDDDQGTYDGARSIEEWKDYIADATLTVPHGGETCADTLPYTSCDSALAEMERLRFSYLNLGYHPDVLDRWRTEGCFDEIERRLGHRLVLTRVVVDDPIDAGRTLHVDLELENRGFAPAYGERRPQLCLQAPGASECVIVDTELSGAGLESVAPGGSGTVVLSGDLPSDLAPGSYELRLAWLDALTDDPQYALLFANDESVSDDERRDHRLATIEVR